MGSKSIDLGECAPGEINLSFDATAGEEYVLAFRAARHSIDDCGRTAGAIAVLLIAPPSSSHLRRTAARDVGSSAVGVSRRNIWSGRKRSCCKVHNGFAPIYAANARGHVVTYTLASEPHTYCPMSTDVRVEPLIPRDSNHGQAC